MRTLGMWGYRHPVVIVLLWLLAIGVVQVAAGTVGPDYRNSFALPDTDSQAAVDLLEERFAEASGDADTLVVSSTEGSVNDPDVRVQVEELLGEVAAIESVAGVRSPYGPMGAAQISPDGTVAYAAVQYATAGIEVPREDLESLTDLVDEAGTETLEVSVGGQGVAALSTPQVGVGELIGVAFAALVLFIAFRSVVAMVLPIFSAAAALGVATGLVRLGSNLVTISDVAPVLGVLLGLGVGIDYALLILNRHRTNLRAGMRLRESVATALDTSGRAVVFAGVTVVIALGGLLVTGIEFLYGMALSAAVSVAFTVLAAGTLLPALLRIAGRRILSPADRRALAAGQLENAPAGPWFTRWANLVARRPVALVLVAVAVLGTIAYPTLDLRLGTADQGNDPAGTTTRQAYDTLAEAFGPGVNGPLLIAVDLSNDPLPALAERADEERPHEPAAGRDPGQQAPVPAQLAGLITDLEGDPAVAGVGTPMPNADGTAALLRVAPTTSPQDQATSDLIDRVRTNIAPAAEDAHGIQVHVGGPTATFDDFAERIQDALPAFISLVIGLSMLLLVLAFRSLLIPLVGALLNLLSAAAAFGVVVAVFQWGWGAELIGLGKAGPIEPFLPVVLFALLFGLSMDYQVFLVSRMHEEWLRTGDNATAVRIGHAATGKVIVVAASIMVFVFGAFVLGDARTIKLMGLGMAAAVLLDAFVIRLLIVPALMQRLGRANWWLPGWMDRVLPHLSIEGPSVTAETAEPVADVPVREGWDRGYADGFAAGRRARYQQGWDAGYAEGALLNEQERYERGYREGFLMAVGADSSNGHPELEELI